MRIHLRAAAATSERSRMLPGPCERGNGSEYFELRHDIRYTRCSDELVGSCTSCGSRICFHCTMKPLLRKRKINRLVKLTPPYCSRHVLVGMIGRTKRQLCDSPGTEAKNSQTGSIKPLSDIVLEDSSRCTAPAGECLKLRKWLRGLVFQAWARLSVGHAPEMP